MGDFKVQGVCVCVCLCVLILMLQHELPTDQTTLANKSCYTRPQQTQCMFYLLSGNNKQMRSQNAIYNVRAYLACNFSKNALLLAAFQIALNNCSFFSATK